MRNKYLDEYRELYDYDIGPANDYDTRRDDRAAARNYDAVSSWAPGIGAGLGAAAGGAIGLVAGGGVGAVPGAAIGSALGGALGKGFAGFADSKASSLRDPHDEESARRQAMADALMRMLS